MTTFSPRSLDTSRLRLNVWTSGPEDGVPVLLVHGNLSTGGFWRYVAQELPDDVRVLAPDLRGFGDTEPQAIDATRGLGDMVDDLRGLLEMLGLTGGRRVHAAGWSMGGGVLEQYLLTHPDDLASVTLVAPLSPYGYGGTKGADGRLIAPDGAGSGGGAGNPEFIRRLAEADASSEDPQTAPRTVLTTFFGPGANAGNVDEDFLVDELLKTSIGDDHYPGDSVLSEHWPGVAPGSRGVLNAMAPVHFDASALGGATGLPPITWLRGTVDQVVSDRSMLDLATLGEMGVVPGWPGADVAPPQPMESQLRAVLEDSGAAWSEVALEGIGHGLPLEVPASVAEAVLAHLR